MNDNLFFDLNELRHVGKNVIIGRTVRVRYPELVSIGDNVIIDDFTYISTALDIVGHVHIAAGCKLIGGRSAAISIGEFSTLAPNVVLAAGSDDYVAGIASPLVPAAYKGAAEIGSITLRSHCIVGANSTVLPNVVFEDGSAVGAQSLVKSSLEAWSLYAGVPARFVKVRNEEAITRLEAQYREEHLCK